MNDEDIIDLFFDRKESAISETDTKLFYNSSAKGDTFLNLF